jgi:organic radical activating enzyme
MNAINRFIERVFPQIRTLPAGIHHYQAPPDAPFPYRLHLRIEPDGSGLLIVNASTVLHLNQTAAEYAYHLVKQTPEEEVVNLIVRRYRIGRDQARKDYRDFQERLQTLIATPDLDPVAYLDFERHEPYPRTVTAPYRLDCALTYKVSDDSHEMVAPVERAERELTTPEWQTLLEKAWRAGVPHVVFTGGEPTLRPDLIDLVAYAEQLGMVTGLLTDGHRLTDTRYLHRLLQSGLDHIMLVLEPTEEQSWEALRDTLPEDIFVAVHLTITSQNAPHIMVYIDRLAQMGVKALSLSAKSPELKDQLEAARRAATHRGISLIWDLPVPYSRLNPIALELEAAGEPATGAGKAWLYVEPDGDVLEAQGMPRVLGNLLRDPWEQIWSKV